MKPFASAPFRTESDISATAAKAIFEPADLKVFPRSPKYRFVPENPSPLIHLLINLKVPDPHKTG